jgi:hypothetical protein
VTAPPAVRERSLLDQAFSRAAGAQRIGRSVMIKLSPFRR